MDMQITYTLRRSARLHADRVAVVDSEVSMTYRELLARIEKVGGMLKSLGVGDGDRVAVLMHNDRRYMELYFGVLWAGGAVVPLNTRLAAPELVFQIDDCEPKVLVLDRSFVSMLGAFQSDCGCLDHILHAGAGDLPEGCQDYDTLVDTADPMADAGRSGDDLMGIFYTGGTTGRSKGVMLTHTSVMTNTANLLFGSNYDETDTYLHVAPMFHLADAGNLWAVTLASATHAFIPGFEPTATLKAIQGFKVTRVVLVPTMINMLINHPDIDKYDLSSLRSVLYGASPIPVAVLQKALDVMGVDFMQGYGMTETSQLATMLPASDHLHPDGSPEQARLKSCGRPCYFTELQVMDEDGNEVPTGEVGEICLRGAHIMAGYWNLPDQTAQALRDGWMHTEDVGYVDEHGYVYLVDRAKDMIVTGGENVYSTEVEAAIYKHTAVLEAAVVGIPSEKWGEAVHAVVVLKEGASAHEAELLEHCKELIANYKCPKSVSFHDGDLPKSGAGKILKRDLRAPFWDGAERGIN